MTEEYIQKLDAELEKELGLISNLELGSKEATDAIKNLEVLSSIRTDIYQKQSDAYAADSKIEQDDKRIQQDAEKLLADKKQSFWTLIINGVTVVISGTASILIPLKIMTAERHGEFWSNRGMNATEKPPKLGFLRLPSFIRK